MGKPKWSVTDARMSGDYTMHVSFYDGTQGVFDARPLLDEPLYVRLRSLPFFLTGRADHGTVIWDDEVDIAPEKLYEAITQPVRE